MAKVVYDDLAQHDDISMAEFFNNAGLKRFTVFGYVMIVQGLVRVLFYEDHTDDTECSGIVIPESCIVEIEYLDNAKVVELKNLA